MSFHLIVLGDSVAWGQGLQEADKYWSKVKDFITPIVQTEVVAHIHAHSGARIAPDTALDARNPMWGEVPVFFPSIHAQLDKVRTEVPPDQPCLILLTGGANDIGLGTVFSVDPTILDKPAWIRKLVRENVRTRLEDLLADIRSAYPAGFIVVTSYFQFVSLNSLLNPALLVWMVRTGLPLVEAGLVAALASQCAAFDEETRSSFAEAVAAVNSQREERVFFAPVPWVPANSLAAPEGHLWLGTDDPLYPSRVAFTETALFTQVPPQAFTPPIQTPVASLGHPNVRGAALFAQAIQSQVEQFREKIAPPAGALFVSQSLPDSMLCGRVYPVSVTMRNTGKQTWVSPFRLGSQSPQDNQTWGTGRADLAGPVAPGALATIKFNVTAPPTPGAYGFQWRMVQEGVRWFGEFTPWTRVGVASAHMKLQVSPRPPMLNKEVLVTVSATDALTGKAVLDAQVFIDGVHVGSTTGSFPHLFKMARMPHLPPHGGGPDPGPPVGWATKPGYETVHIDFGFDQ